MGTETSMLKEMSMAKLFLSGLVWYFITPQHFYLSEVLSLLSFCVWIITRKKLSFFKKRGIAIEPGFCLRLAMGSSQNQPSSGTAAMLLILPQLRFPVKNRKGDLFAVGDFFILWNSYWKRFIWIFRSCFNSLYLHFLLFMNICTLKGTADLLKTSVKKAFLVWTRVLAVHYSVAIYF